MQKDHGFFSYLRECSPKMTIKQMKEVMMLSQDGDGGKSEM